MAPKSTAKKSRMAKSVATKNRAQKLVQRVALPPPEFVAELAVACRGLLHDFAGHTLAELMDVEDIRSLVHGALPQALHAETVVTKSWALVESAESLIAAEGLSLDSLLDKKIKKHISDVLAVDIELTDASKEFVGKVMRAEFIRSLFTDVIHVTLVGFYKKLNPLFGGLATKMLETQIRSFIEMFIKIVLDRAVEFVVSPQNVSLFTEFAREVVRLLMAEKISHLAMQVSPAHRSQLQAVAREALQNSAFQEKLRELALTGLDEAWDLVRDVKFGEVLNVVAIPDELLQTIARFVAPVFASPPIKSFLQKWGTK